MKRLIIWLGSVLALSFFAADWAFDRRQKVRQLSRAAFP